MDLIARDGMRVSEDAFALHFPSTLLMHDYCEYVSDNFFALSLDFFLGFCESKLLLHARILS